MIDLIQLHDVITEAFCRSCVFLSTYDCTGNLAIFTVHIVYFTICFYDRKTTDVQFICKVEAALLWVSALAGFPFTFFSPDYWLRIVWQSTIRLSAVRQTLQRAPLREPSTWSYMRSRISSARRAGDGSAGWRVCETTWSLAIEKACWLNKLWRWHGQWETP